MISALCAASRETASYVQIVKRIQSRAPRRDLQSRSASRFCSRHGRNGQPRARPFILRPTPVLLAIHTCWWTLITVPVACDAIVRPRPGCIDVHAVRCRHTPEAAPYPGDAGALLTAAGAAPQNPCTFALWLPATTGQPKSNRLHKRLLAGIAGVRVYCAVGTAHHAHAGAVIAAGSAVSTF